jgi:hypothetical protein
MRGQRYAQAALYPPGKSRYPFYRRLGGSQSCSGRAKYLAPTGIRSPDRPAFSQCPHPLRYPDSILRGPNRYSSVHSGPEPLTTQRCEHCGWFDGCHSQATSSLVRHGPEAFTSAAWFALQQGRVSLPVSHHLSQPAETEFGVTMS